MKISGFNTIINRYKYWRKYPIIHQYDCIDCGPAALLSILKYYGGNASLSHVRELCNTDGQGTTMLDLVNAAKILGFSAWGAKGKYEELITNSPPFIAHVVSNTNLNHFVVIYKIDQKKILIGDPDRGLYQTKKNNFISIWKQNAVIIMKPKSFLYCEAPKSISSWIFGYVKKYETWIYQTIFLGFVYTILGLLTALFIQMLIDSLIPGHEFKKIIYTGIFLTVLLSLKALVNYARKKLLIELNKRININVNSDFINHVFRLPKHFFDTRKIGDITSRISDSVQIQQAITIITNTLIIDIFILIGSLILMYHLTSYLTLATFIMIILYLLILSFHEKRLKKKHGDVMKAYAKVESSYIDSLRGIDDINSFNVAKSFIINNQWLFEHFQFKIEHLNLIKIDLFLSVELSGTILSMIILTFGAIQVLRNQLMLGQMMASFSLLTNILPAVLRIFEANVTLQGAYIAANRLRDILLIKQEQSYGKQPFKIQKSLTLKNGKFAWPKSKVLFHNLEFTLEKGKMVSLWGQTGSGKSTLVQLLQRKYSLLQGQILIDKIPIEQFDLAEYRKLVAVVPQNIRIFNGTILHNITLGREVIDEKNILNKMYQFGLESFLSKFENGLLTLIGEDSRQLSAGETQILALIRALFDNPEILIIDEGFNTIDIKIEKLILNTIKEYANNHAVLIITHNPIIILQTDYIYILENGSISENTTPKQFLYQNAHYFADLIRVHNIHQKPNDYPIDHLTH